jgi:hypothetical protein
VRPSGGPLTTGERPRCFLCGRATYDPDKRGVPWARGVANGRQALICPECQRDRPDWAAALDRCRVCGGTRLSAMLGEIVCRACGHTERAASAGA